MSIIVVSSAFEEARKILTAAGYQMKHEYSIGPKFQGFSANMSERLCIYINVAFVCVSILSRRSQEVTGGHRKSFDLS